MSRPRKIQSRPRIKQPPPQPWHTYLTLDLIISAAQKSILHWFVAWILPLSLRAVTVPYQDLSFRLSVAYASLLTVLKSLSIFNHRLVYGPVREVDHADEVVVITGGSSGLGLLIAGFYRMNGAAVAVLDIKPLPADEQASGLRFYQCDISDATQLESCFENIKKELGIPSILINNAGMVLGIPILQLSPEEAERSLKVNLLSHFHTVRLVLPGMLAQGFGTIVTVSSVLGHLGCANLSDYTASKAGLMAFHASLRAELQVMAASNPAAAEIKTILVAPGQLGTPMFAGLRTPSNFLAPVVEPVELAREIVRLIDEGDSGEIRLPFYTKLVPLLMACPIGVQQFARWITGMDSAMIRFAKESKKSI